MNIKDHIPHLDIPPVDRQRTPTVDADGNPLTCYVCGMHAVCVGYNPNMKDSDPHYICEKCKLDIKDLRAIRRLDPLEVKALEGGVEAVGRYIMDNGGVTDLAYFDDLSQRMLVKAAWEGCAKELRRLLSEEAPF